MKDESGEKLISLHTKGKYSNNIKNLEKKEIKGKGEKKTKKERKSEGKGQSVTGVRGALLWPLIRSKKSFK